MAIPIGVEKTFTYLIPPELMTSAVIGVRATVSFGRKYVTGMIVGLPSSSPLPSLKPIRDILDPAPIISAELLKLCRWIAEYYFAPLGEVLKAALPHGFAGPSKRLVRLNPDSELFPVNTRARSRKRSSLLVLLREHGPMLSTDLQKRAGVKSIHAVLHALERQGIIVTEEIIPRPKQSIKVKEFVLIEDIDRVKLEVELQSLPPRKKKSAQLLAALSELRSQDIREMALDELLKRSGVSSAVLKPYKASSLLRIERREIRRQQDYGTDEQTRSIILNTSQKDALSRITTAMNSATHKVLLLHGVTGSGKTQVYIEAIRCCLASGKSAIVLVPEISLTPQIVRRFKTHFGNTVVVVHSQMSAGERYDAWRLALRGEHRVVIGPRSAIFAPLSNIGLIVVDEEHESSYKQYDQTPRYHGRDVAVLRGKLHNAVVVLGSATPSVESYSNALAGKYELLEMPQRIDEVPMPEIIIVDMTAERKHEYAEVRESLPQEKRSLLKNFQQSSISALLKEKIAERLARSEGIILLQNRRGFAPFVECVDCGYAETCEQCNVTMTYHLTRKHLRCHYCGTVRPPRTQCPQCSGTHLQLKGIGTQRVEQELASLFPDARILRMDVDTTSRKGAHHRILRKFGDGDADILLGTQMVAKGLDFPRVTLVGVISADTQMLLPDFRSTERTFQLLTQVAGRAGRSKLHGEVIIQTHQPQHYTLQHVIDHDFKAFYQQELAARKELDYPPFSRIVLLESKGKNEEHARRAAEQFVRLLGNANRTFTVLGPAPAVISKIRNLHRWHVIIKNLKTADPSGSHLRQELRRAIGEFSQRKHRSARLLVDVDPVGLM
jgi:primosomal protein N' (replication factor Y)